MPRKKNTCMYLVAALLFLGGLGYLVFSGLSENTVYFLNVSEARAATADKLQAARLFGTVARDGLFASWLTVDIPGASFLLQDKDDAGLTLPVVYKGAVPDTFKAGAEVIVEGGLQPDGRFMARTLMTKCPSKYQKENRKS